MLDFLDMKACSVTGMSQLQKQIEEWLQKWLQKLAASGEKSIIARCAQSAETIFFTKVWCSDCHGNIQISSTLNQSIPGAKYKRSRSGTLLSFSAIHCRFCAEYLITFFKSGAHRKPKL